MQDGKGDQRGELDALIDAAVHSLARKDPWSSSRLRTNRKQQDPDKKQLDLQGFCNTEMR
jgi:hypothetical protein